MNNKVTNEIKLDALIAAAAEEALLQELNQIPDCDELDKIYKPSSQLDKRNRNLIHGRNRAAMMRKTTRTVGRIAAVFAVVFAIGTITLLSVEASRNYVLHTFIEWYDDHIRFDFSDANHAEAGRYILTYVPNGFVLESSLGTGEGRLESYTDRAGGSIVFQQGSIQGGPVSVDIEQVNYSLMKIGDITAHAFERKEDNGSSTILWVKGNTVFDIVATVEFHEIVTMVESVQMK